MRFTGTIEAKTDAKGRIFLPAVFRKALCEEELTDLILARDAFESCLVIYTKFAWETRLNELRARLNSWDAKHKMVFRQFVADVVPFGLDGNGRFLVPKRFMQYAGIESEVTFLGMDDTIEIWAKVRTEDGFMSAADFSVGLQEVMSRRVDEVSL